MIINSPDSRTSPSFSIKNRLYRFIWGITWALFFRTTPNFFHPWRRLLLIFFGAKIGRNSHIYPKVIIWSPKLLRIENRVGVGNNVIIYNMAPIEIKENAVISQGAHLCAGTHDITDPNFQLFSKPITIGKNSWVCTEAFIGPGVNIHDGCVIGARSVLMKDTHDVNMVYAGNPAKKIKNRFQKINRENT